MPKLASSWENVIIDSHCLFFSNFMYRFLLILLFKENLDIYLTLCIVICKLCKSKTPSPVDIESFVNVDVVLDQTRIFLIFFYFIILYDMIYTLHTIPHQLSVEFFLKKKNFPLNLRSKWNWPRTQSKNIYIHMTYRSKNINLL